MGEDIKSEIKLLQKKIDEQQKRLDDIFAEVQKFRKNGLKGIIISIVMFVLPIIGLTIYIRQFFGPILQVLNLER